MQSNQQQQNAEAAATTTTPQAAETDDETLALRKRRRVSFADVEITSVHIFNRDEDYETPPDAEPKRNSPPSSPPAPSEAAEVFSFLKELADRETVRNEDEEEEEDEGVRESFLRPAGSPSPGGSSSARSVNSNDEEDFFGPVSASFIRPRRVSNSAASDDNHDITMDSTAFSMHFRSLARSESGGELKTPTGNSVGSEDKTLMDNASKDPGTGSSMVLTRTKKLLFAEPVADDKASVGGYSGDMSLVGDNSQRYDYGRLSPTLNALLAEGIKDMHPVAVSHPSSSKTLSGPGGSAFVQNTIDIQDISVSSDAEMGNFGNQNTSVNTFSEAPLTLCEVDGVPDGIRTPNQISKSNNLSSYAPEYGSAASKSLPEGDRPSDNLEVFAQSISLPKALTQHSADEDSVQDNDIMPSKHLNLESPFKSPLAASVSSAYAKQLQLFDDIEKSSGNPINSTPSPKHLGPLSSNLGNKHGGSMSSIRKSLSELKHMSSSPYASLLTVGSERLWHESSLKDDVIDNNKDLWSSHARAPAVCLEDRLRNFDPSNKNLCRAPTTDNSMDINRTDTPNKFKGIESLNQSEEPRNLGKFGDVLQNMHVDGPKKDEPTSSPQLRMFAEKAELSISRAENRGLTESSTKSASMNEKTEIRTGVDERSLGTPSKRSPQKLHNSIERQRRLLGDKRPLSQADENTRVANKRHEISNCGGQLIALVDKGGNINQSSPPRSYLKDLTEMTRVADRVNELYFRCNETNTVDTLQTPLRNVTAPNFQFGSFNRNFRSGTGASKSLEELKERLKYLPGGSASSYKNKRHSIRHSLHESSDREAEASILTRKESTLNPIIQESHHVLQSDKTQHQSGNFSNQTSEQPIIDGQQVHQILQSPIHLQNVVHSAHKKSGEIPIEENVDTSEVNESGGSGLKFILEQSNNNEKNIVETRAEALPMRVPDILSKITGSTEQLLCPIVDKLDVKSIDMLEDTLDHLQRGKEYEMRSGFQSQKAFDGFKSIRHKRAAEAKMTFYKIIYEHAKVQLLRAKRERLENNVQKINSAYQECQSLKCKLNSVIQGSAKSNVANGSPHSEQCSSAGHHVDSEKLTLMKQNIGSLEQDLRNLTKSFHHCLKMEGETNSVDTLALANDHLKKRMRHKLLRQKLQLWEVVGFEVRNGHKSIVLNYHGFLSRRFTISSAPTSSLSISDRTDDAKIRKNFPNMDACTAFSFVMNSENIEKYFGSRRLTEVAQITSSLLQNLLDVLGEVQLVHLQVRGLVQTSFYSPSDQQLNLQLCFIDFTSGRQLAMTLDVTCLNRGIYPSEAVPYQIHERASEVEKPVPSLLSTELRAAFQSLEAGFSRISMLCSCVSQVLQSSSW